MKKFAKLGLLLWKDWKITTRHPVTLFFFFAIPLIGSFLILGFELIVARVYYNIQFYNDENPTLFGGKSQNLPTNQVVIAWTGNGNHDFRTTARSVMRALEKNGIKPVELSSEEKLIEYLQKPNIMEYSGNISVICGVIFENPSDSNMFCKRNLQMTFKFPGLKRSNSKSWLTRRRFPLFDWLADSEYKVEGFVNTQALISRSILVNCGGSQWEEEVSKIRIRMFPHPSRHVLSILIKMALLRGLFLLVAFILPFTSTVITMAKEKESQLKESMQIMGLSNILHWCAWSIRTMIILCIIIVIIVICWKIKVNRQVLLEKTEIIFFFMFLLVYAMATTCLCFLVSVIFEREYMAAIAAVFVWIASTIPGGLMILYFDEVYFTLKVFACLLSNTALLLGVFLMMNAEAGGEGANWKNACSPKTCCDELTLTLVLLVLFIDSVIYFLCAVYVECVFPGSNGIPRPWYFLFEKKYWFKEKVKIQINRPGRNIYRTVNPRNFESDPAGQELGVELLHIEKNIPGTTFNIRNLSLNIYQDQVTVLLGSNSSGKTTILKLLTGMDKPTSGTAIVNGYDIIKEREAALENISICWQRNVLIEELTVKEHLTFFSQLKGFPEEETQRDIDKYMNGLELEPRKDTQVRRLSSGIQRRVSIAIALCGNSKVVLLDEPSAGVDRAACHLLWNTIRSERNGRAIVLTTEDMREADVLADRVAVIVRGQLIGCGSPFFLKDYFGSGYKLKILKGPQCKTARVTDLLRRHSKTLNVLQVDDKEIIYLLDESENQNFLAMFRDLEDESETLNVLSYEIAAPNMEDVFIKTIEESERNRSMTPVKINEPTQDEELLGVELLTGYKLLRNHFIAMLYKNIVMLRRHLLLYMLHCFLPVTVYIMIREMQRSRTNPSNPQPLNITLDWYNTYVNNRTRTWLIEEKQDNPHPHNYRYIYNNYKDVLSENNNVFHDLSAVRNPEEVLQTYIAEEHTEVTRDPQHGFIIAASFTTEKYTAWYQTHALHSLPISYNMMINAMLRNISMSLWIVNSPLPLTANEHILLQANEARSQGVNISLALSLGFVVALFIVLPIHERTTKWKHLQFVTGVGPFTYWGTYFVWSFALFIPPIVLLIIVISIYKDVQFSTSSELGELLLILILFALATLPFVYVLSFAFVWIEFGYCVTVIIVSSLELIIEFVKIFEEDSIVLLYWQTLQPYLMLLPTISFFDALSKLSNRNLNKRICDVKIRDCPVVKEDGCCPGKCPRAGCLEIVDNIFIIGPVGIGENVLNLIIQSIVYFMILIAIEHRQYLVIKFKKNEKKTATQQPEEPLEEDVEKEKTLILSSTREELSEQYTVCLRNVSKYHKKRPVVDGVYLGVEKGECFGLFGAIGAGKTVLFRIMIGDILYYRGDTFVLGHKIAHYRKVFGRIGYCPQVDALFKTMTGRETLSFICFIRGIPRDKIAKITTQIATVLLFTEFLDTKVNIYSDGTKRKLSIAVALVGHPKVVFLDQPTVGMDPVARKRVWGLLNAIRETGTSIISTSHRFDERQAIWSRIVIMTNGRFKYLGTLRHLKQKFSEGYVLRIKVRADLEMVSNRVQNSIVGSINNIKWFIDTTFPGSVLRDEYSTLLVFLITKDFTYSKIFSVLEEAKYGLNIEDYHLSPTDLEQVFLKLTKHQVSSPDN